MRLFMHVAWYCTFTLFFTCSDANSVAVTGLEEGRYLEEDNPFVSLHINCGATETHTDSSTGKVWIPDTGFIGEGSSSNLFLVAGLEAAKNDDESFLYQSLRQTNAVDTPLSYLIDVPDGDYTMVFHLIDSRSDDSDESRVIFDLWVQGRVVVSNMDIALLAGGRRRPYLARRRVIVEDGRLQAKLIPVQGPASVAAIELVLRKRAATEPLVTTAAPVPRPPTVATATAIPVQVIVGASPNLSPTPSPVRSPIIPSTTPDTTKPTGPFLDVTIPAQIIPRPTYSPSSLLETQTATSFEPLRINAGGRTFVQPTDGTVWERDRFYVNGAVYARYADIAGTADDVLFASERFGNFRYEIPLPIAQYEVILYFAEIHFTTPGARLFSIQIQNEVVFPSVDLFALGGGSQEITLEAPVVVSEGTLSIQFISSGVGYPKLNALEVVMVESHLAHAVTQGPYVSVDNDGDGSAVVVLDGTLSHTHGYSLVLTEWNWIIDQKTRTTGEVTNVQLPVGKHVVTLSVTDSGGNENAASTTIDVLPWGHPWISSIQPRRGLVAGGETVTLSGYGFGNVIGVQFGDMKLFKSEITILNATSIQFLSPLASLARPVSIQVETIVGTSNTVSFTFYDGSPVVFINGRVASIPSPTAVAFGPDHKLYVGTSRGQLFKLTLDNSWNVVESVSSSLIANLENDRMILGVAFDPTDVWSDNPSVYVSHSRPFHGSSQSSSRATTNGKVSKLSGANLGIPVSDHDHAVNGLEFGDHGELYIQVAGSTNSGVPGGLSSTKLLKDNIVSGATLVAHLGDEGFTGRLVYDATDDGNLLPGSGVEIFAHGLRNPYGLTLHSNGKLYGTDNGPNINFGSRSLSCNGEELPGIQEDDKLLLLEKNHYYGQPNRKRGSSDPRQCVWHSVNDPDQGYNFTAPLATNPSSIDGIIEFQTNHFGGQLRHNLIVAKYKKQLYRVILNADGTAVLPQSKPLLPLTGSHALDVTQAPDGTLVVAQYLLGTVAFYKPLEEMQQQLLVYGVFPRRGPVPTIPRLTVFVSTSSTSLTNAQVTVGPYSCPVIETIRNRAIVCGPIANTSGTPGTVDVEVTLVNGDRQTLARGFRFITGRRFVEQ